MTIAEVLKLSAYCVERSEAIRAVALSIDHNRRGFAMIVEDGRFHTTVTDGDIRRAMLAGATLDEPLEVVLEQKARSGIGEALTGAPGVEDAHAQALMRRHSVRQLPIVDDDRTLLDVIFLDEIQPILPMSAVIMAGGFGTRLRPLTDETPKPMLPVGERPLMEHIVKNLSAAGISDVRVTTHYRPDQIKDHFGDGSAFGVDLSYTNEDEPLGTAGALGLLSRPTQPLLVINGDILTRMNPRALFEFHKEHGAELTVGVRHYEFHVPYGVVETDGEVVTSLREKPSIGFLVNAGVYLLEPSALDVLAPRGTRQDMTDVIETLVEARRKVVSFPVIEEWIDIGHHADYERAQTAFANEAPS